MTILKDVQTNVEIIDKETKEILFRDHNIFTNLGKQFHRDLTANTKILEQSAGYPKYAIQLGNPTTATTPAYSDTNINDLTLGYTGVGLIASPNGITVTNISSSSFEVQFTFEYTNAESGAVNFKELGLFYRPGVDYPAITSGEDNILLARMRATHNKVIIGVGRTIQFNWKILF